MSKDEKIIEVIKLGTTVKISFPSETLATLRSSLEAERDLRPELNDDQFTKLVLSLMDFKKTCSIKDYSLKIMLFFLSRFETEVRGQNLFEKITKEEFERRSEEFTKNQQSQETEKS